MGIVKRWNDMEREKAIKLLEHISIAYTPTDAYGDYDDPQPYEEALDMAISALSEQTNCFKCSHYHESETENGYKCECDADTAHTDLISRADAIEAFDRGRVYHKSGIEEIINALPSAEAVQGEWILVKGSNGKDYHKCSKCLHTQEITGVKNYCAVCGAKMKGGAE